MEITLMRNSMSSEEYREAKISQSTNEEDNIEVITSSSITASTKHNRKQQSFALGSPNNPVKVDLIATMFF